MTKRVLNEREIREASLAYLIGFNDDHLLEFWHVDSENIEKEILPQAVERFENFKDYYFEKYHRSYSEFVGDKDTIRFINGIDLYLDQSKEPWYNVSVAIDSWTQLRFAHHIEDNTISQLVNQVSEKTDLDKIIEGIIKEKPMSNEEIFIRELLEKTYNEESLWKSNGIQKRRYSGVEVSKSHMIPVLSKFNHDTSGINKMDLESLQKEIMEKTVQSIKPMIEDEKDSLYIIEKDGEKRYIFGDNEKRQKYIFQVLYSIIDEYKSDRTSTLEKRDRNVSFMIKLNGLFGHPKMTAKELRESEGPDALTTNTYNRHNQNIKIVLGARDGKYFPKLIELMKKAENYRHIRS